MEHAKNKKKYLTPKSGNVKNTTLARDILH
jgi:hypothetical protein